MTLEEEEEDAKNVDVDTTNKGDDDGNQNKYKGIKEPYFKVIPHPFLARK